MPSRPSALALATATPARRAGLAVTVLLGLLGAAGADAQGAGSLAEVSRTVQAALSVSLPFVSAGLAHAARRDPRPGPGPTPLGAVAAAVLLAVVVAGYGYGVSWVLLLLTGTPPGAGPAGTLVASVAVQVLAAVVGTGLGFLVSRVWVAGVLTVVAPLGCYLLLRSTPAAVWTTPYANVRALLDGRPSGPDWLHWSVVLLLWGLLLNAAGGWRVRRRGA